MEVFIFRCYIYLILLFASSAPNIITDPAEVTNQTSAELSCNLTGTTLPIKGHHWLLNGKIIEASKSEANTPHTVLM